MRKFMHKKMIMRSKHEHICNLLDFQRYNNVKKE